ncbi:MAG: glycosyltransferase family 2 protein [Planctomycetaceae bacterium]
MTRHSPRITICIPHWQVRDYMTLCLRSVRKHSARYDLEVIVVDNGSRDESLEYLLSLSWIRLIERPEEVHTNWPLNVFTAWDRGLEEAAGEFYVTMHSDVFIKRDDWLDPFLREMGRSDRIAAAGAWKLELEHPLYAAQKRLFGYAAAKLKTLAGRRSAVAWRQGHYPRDYCAMYRRAAIVRHGLTFRPVGGCGGGGYSIARQLWDAGYETAMFPVREMARRVYHVAHGTAAVREEKPLNHRRAQKKVERKVGVLFDEDWIKSLQADDSLDRAA